VPESHRNTGSLPFQLLEQAPHFTPLMRQARNTKLEALNKRKKLQIHNSRKKAANHQLKLI
jgi:hypothetical protein